MSDDLQAGLRERNERECSVTDYQIAQIYCQAEPLDGGEPGR
jgi:hypothetical protein